MSRLVRIARWAHRLKGGAKLTEIPAASACLQQSFTAQCPITRPVSPYLEQSLRLWGSWTREGGDKSEQDGSYTARAASQAKPSSLSVIFLDLLDSTGLGFWSSLRQRRPNNEDFTSIKEEFTWSQLEREGFSQDDLEYMLRKFPGLLDLSMTRVIEPAISFLKSLGIPKEIVCRMAAECPKILSLGVAEDLEPFFSGLVSAGIDRPEAAALLSMGPTALEKGTSGMQTMRTALTAGAGLEWWEAGPVLREVIARGRSPAQLQALVSYYSSLGVHQEQLRRLALFHPWTLSLQVEDLQCRVNHLYGHQMTTEEIGRVIAAAPNTVLSSSTEDLRSRMLLLARLSKLGGWKSPGQLLVSYPTLIEASSNKLRYLQHIFTTRGINGKKLIGVLAAQTNPVQWAKDLLAMQLSSDKSPRPGKGALGSV